MRFKAMIAAIAVSAGVSALFFPVMLTAQVAPAAHVGALPIGIGLGMSSYNLDYGPGRRMEGPVIRAQVGIYHGLGVDVSARAIFMFTPPELTRMQQNTYLGGLFYDGLTFGRFRPFVRGAVGLGTIEFPSRNPKYTRDSYTVYAPSGGVEYRLTPRVALRADYEYQLWKDFQSKNYLTPQGFTGGVTYYLRSHHLRPHPEG
jgi:opacity protein-like surface antigen